MLPEDIQKEFDRLKPWACGFIINGRKYGGEYEATSDGRLDGFFKYFPNAQTILELGSFEGAQTFALAKHPTVKRLLALEARTESIEKARLVQRLMGITNVEFRHADIETLALSALGRFDVVLCAGVLYHVPAPWNLISRIASVSKNVYVCTHYSEVKRANVIIRGYRGRMYREPPLDNPQAGLSRFSFWPTLSSLLDMFRAYGFKTIHVIDDNPKFRNGPYVTLAASAP